VNVNIQQLVANINIGNAVVDISNLLNGNQIQALVQALNDNPQASQNSKRLTSALQKKNALAKNEKVVGVKDDKVYKLNPKTARAAQARSGPAQSRASSASRGSAPAASQSASGGNTVTAGPVTQNATANQLGQAMLDGLVNVNVQQVVANVSVQNLVVSVSDVLNNNDIQVLLQALNQNPQATQNASRLTDALRDQGKLSPAERVVGLTNGKVYKYAKQQ
jgi:hypothetical protein